MPLKLHHLSEVCSAVPSSEEFSLITSLQLQKATSNDSLKRLQNSFAISMRTLNELKVKRDTEINVKLRELRKKLTCLCAKLRNEFSESNIKKDFASGLLEMRKRSHYELEDFLDPGNVSDDEEDDVEDADQFSALSEQLNVFCVSSLEYLKLSGLMPLEGSSAVFDCVDDTGILALKRMM